MFGDLRRSHRLVLDHTEITAAMWPDKANFKFFDSLSDWNDSVGHAACIRSM